MSKRKLLISPKAQSDLTNIHRYSCETWGTNLADKYLDTINDTMWHLTSHPYLGQLRLELAPKTRSFAIRNHIVFYRESAHLIQILRVLHDSQDPTSHFMGQDDN